jgi:hypothetical protein
MNTTRPLSETLQSLLDAGYRLADTHIASLSNEALQSDDWRLDKLSQIRDQDKRTMVLVIAVSSATRGLKLVFVEVIDPASPFTPLQLVRRLFPMDHRPGRPVKNRQVA